ncbi:MAG: 1-deoxy-D-xylulose-5-phosphate synthase [Oscillospiraceae bacterium]|nr:1-deoxy-D-xylulose-5-phosphate synthase [Oscillospiraceae bacterium]
MDLPDLHCISVDEAEKLCVQLRQRLIETVSKTGGHLASSLGVVELTVALHRVFDTGEDRLVFDVGHQCYCHKILTGRDDRMDTLRCFGGLSGFPKPYESVHDAFIAGHASTAISVALGMARARTAAGANYSVVALVGDGALTGGLAYEGLSNAGESGEPMIIILNDNGMSITKNVGGIAQHLAHQRLKPQYLRWKRIYRRLTEKVPGGRALYRLTHKIKKAIKFAILPGSIFEHMGVTYLGPVDGHDVSQLTKLLNYCRSYCRTINGPVMLHVRTVKGKGYPPAEENPDVFHGVGPFRVEDGALLKEPKPDFSSTFGSALCQLAEQDRRVCAITAAMQSGTGLDEFSTRFPDRFFDVGIAEGHAVTMAAGMAKQGMIPVFAVYSSFLQRSYDMLLHDVALQNLHVILAIDRAGLVGEDGETHHGVFDVAFLDTIPGMTVLCPSNFQELRTMLRRAIYDLTGPVAVRYPKGGEDKRWQEDRSEDGAFLVREGGDITLLGYGAQIPVLIQVAQRLSQENIQADVVKLNYITPIDYKPIIKSVEKTGRLFVAEECVEMNCVGQRILTELSRRGVSLRAAELRNLGRGFVTHGSVEQLRRLCGLDEDSLFQKALEVCRRG